MRHLYKNLIFFLAIITISCSEKLCDDLDSGVYVYPDASGKSLEEAFQFYKIPEQVLKCISTDGLIQSCIAYPEMRMIWTRNSLQQGFDFIEDKCNGFDELWRRSDKYQALIELYLQLDFEWDWTNYPNSGNGQYFDNILRHELILAQNEILQDLTDNQKLELFQIVLEKLKVKKTTYKNFDGFGVAGSIAILSRVMFNDQYLPFLEKFEDNWDMLVVVELIHGMNVTGNEEVVTLSEDYLEILKNK